MQPYSQISSDMAGKDAAQLPCSPSYVCCATNGSHLGGSRLEIHEHPRLKTGMNLVSNHAPCAQHAPQSWLVSHTEPPQAYRHGLVYVYSQVLFAFIVMIGLACLVP